MKILLTNDDGIESKGLLLIAKWAVKHGEVLIAAPLHQQSGTSQAIEIHEPFIVKKVAYQIDVPAYAVDSTPADCVRFATAALDFEPDLIISGVNCGFNVGVDIVYSATVGAIFEGATSGYQGLAISTHPESFDDAEAHLDEVWDYIMTRDLFSKNDLYNVNIPVSPKRILMTKQAGPYYRDKFRNVGDDLYIADGYSIYKGTSNLDLDLDAVMNGYISITPLTLNRTASVYDELKDEQ